MKVLVFVSMLLPLAAVAEPKPCSALFSQVDSQTKDRMPATNMQTYIDRAVRTETDVKYLSAYGVHLLVATYSDQAERARQLRYVAWLIGERKKAVDAKLRMEKIDTDCIVD